MSIPTGILNFLLFTGTQNSHFTPLNKNIIFSNLLQTLSFHYYLLQKVFMCLSNGRVTNRSKVIQYVILKKKEAKTHLSCHITIEEKYDKDQNQFRPTHWHKKTTTINHKTCMYSIYTVFLQRHPTVFHQRYSNQNTCTAFQKSISSPPQIKQLSKQPLGSTKTCMCLSS